MKALSTVDAPDAGPKIFTKKGLFVMPIASTSYYNFLTFWTFLECFYMILIKKKSLETI